MIPSWNVKLIAKTIFVAGFTVGVVGLVFLVLGFIWGRYTAPPQTVEVPTTTIEICDECLNQAELNQKNIYLQVEEK